MMKVVLEELRTREEDGLLWMSCKLVIKPSNQFCGGGALSTERGIDTCSSYARAVIVPFRT